MTRLALVIVAFAAACSSFAAARQPDDPIAKHVAWRGAALAEAETLVRSGEIETAGLTGTLVVQERRDGRQRMDVDLQVVQVTETLDGDGGWRVDPSGQVEDLGELTALYTRRTVELDFLAPLAGETGADVSVLDDEEKDGATWSVIRVAYAGGDSHDLFVDPDTGALGWMRTRQDTAETWVEYADWKLVDGVRFPGVRRETTEDGAGDSVIRWTDNALNAPIDDAVFERPAVGDRVFIAGGGDSTGWIPFEFYRGQRLYLPAAVNGYETEAILDSGAELSVIDDDVAAAAGIVGAGDLTAQGTGGTAQAQLATGVTLTVGGLEIRDMTVVVIDLDEVGGRLLGRPLPIILGKEVFNETIVDIDYPNRRIAFHDPDAWTYDGDGAVTPVTQFDGLRVVEISVEGGAPIRAGFDVGQGSALTLFEAYVEETGLFDGRTTSDHLSGGVGGASVNGTGTVKSFEFAGFTFRDVPVGLPRSAEGAFDTAAQQANLGTDVFKRFRMIVNYADDQLILEPDAEAMAAPFAKDRAGVQVAETANGVELIHVATGSPAAAAGLKAGDVVTHVNGARIGAGYWDGDVWRWTQGREGTDVTLALADGREVALTLADYY